MFWFSGHLHVKFEAMVVHPEESARTSCKATRFLALDKVTDRGGYLQVINIQPTVPAGYATTGDKASRPTPHICYDMEWLAILKANESNLPLSSFRVNAEDIVIPPSPTLLEWTRQRVVKSEAKIRSGEEEEGVSPTAPAMRWPGWSQPHFKDLTAQRKYLLDLLDISEDRVEAIGRSPAGYGGAAAPSTAAAVERPSCVDNRQPNIEQEEENIFIDDVI
eukprot:GHVS01066596.1.p2 GENE.GHVS01066596.1~~GHVS01066596.1.p2  ORF type:complete len:220 (-),score=35.72 GHVS01066596.1:155-814(-)